MKLANLIKKFNQFKSNNIIRLPNPFASSGQKLLFSYISVLLVLLLAGCQRNGIVGSKLPGKKWGVTTDTFLVSSTQSLSLVSYPGNRGYISAGKFHDPLFGDIKVTGMLVPTLLAKDSTLTFDQNTQMKLKLFFHTKTVYGNKTKREQFNIVPIDEIWRGKQWKINDKVNLKPGPPIGSFTVGSEDSIVTSLADAYLQKYLTFYNNTDSTRFKHYRAHFHGFALVPQNANKIVTINPIRSEILLEGVKVHTDSSVARDTLSLNFGTWTYSLKRTNVPQTTPKSTKILSTLENILRLDFHLTKEEVKLNNVSEAEIIVYRNIQKLKNSLASAGPNVVRPESDTLQLYFARPEDLLSTLDAGSGIFSTYQSDNNSYHFHINTRRLPLIINADSIWSIYITPRGFNGIIRENLLYNNKSSDFKPKIIITHTTAK